MPIYEYKCKKCGKEFEEIRSSKADCIIICPACGDKDVVKKLSLFGSGPSKEGGSSCSPSSRFT